MSDESDMQDWWDKIGEDAQAAWCAHAAVGDPITPAMAHSIGVHDGSSDPGWIYPTTVADGPGREGADWSMSDGFRAFIERQCQP